MPHSVEGVQSLYCNNKKDKIIMKPSVFKSAKAKQAVYHSYANMLAKWPVQYCERDLETDFGTTHIIQAGSDFMPPLILLHSWGGNATQWFANIAQLASQFKIYAVDIIGEMGKSEEACLAYNSDDYVQWLGQILSQLNLGKVHILGSSIGATLAIRFAARHEDKVDRMVLVAPLGLDRLNSRVLWYKRLGNTLALRALSQQLYRYTAGPGPVQAPTWALDDYHTRLVARRVDGTRIPLIKDEDLAHLSANSLLVLGEDDVLQSVENILDKVRRAAPEVQLSIMEKVGHPIHIEQAERLNAIASHFLQEM